MPCARILCRSKYDIHGSLQKIENFKIFMLKLNSYFINVRNIWEDWMIYFMSKNENSFY